MEREDDFYVVLPSNSSMKFFPDNTISCFTTRLSREIRVSGEWCVGLAEIHIPCTMMHIQESEATFEVNFTNEKYQTVRTHNFPHGVYDKIEQLVESINIAEDFNKHLSIEPSTKQKGFYALNRKCPETCTETHTVIFPEKIRRIFGFESPEHRITGSITSLDEETRDVEASRPAVLARAIPDQLFVYSDVCVPYTVGDTETSLLRIMSLNYTKYQYGSNVVTHFAPIHYIPLLQHSFQTITIDIRDKHGEAIPFEFGTSTVTLHFMRKR